MTKQVNDKNQIWFEQQDGVVKVGFTKSFLDGMDQCWHIMPAHLAKFREKTPLMVVETNDALISIMSPISANFGHWNAKAQNFPDKLTEEDVILEAYVGKKREVVNEDVRVDMNGQMFQFANNSVTTGWAASPAVVVRGEPTRPRGMSATERLIAQRQMELNAASQRIRNTEEDF